MPPGVSDFVWGATGKEGAAEQALAALGLPAACGAGTCGVDFAVVSLVSWRRVSEGQEVVGSGGKWWEVSMSTIVSEASEQ